MKQTIELQKDLKYPNLDIRVTQGNKLKHLKYYSFEERVFDVASLFNSSLDEEYTKVIGSNTYCSREFEPNHRDTDIIFNGVYKLAPMSEYMGFIPEKNQIEINTRFESLVNNPFLNQDFKLMILAPLNNFATENNISAIDPIAFAYFEDGEHCCKKNCLITLSQWV